MWKNHLSNASPTNTTNNFQLFESICWNFLNAWFFHSLYWKCFLKALSNVFLLYYIDCHGDEGFGWNWGYNTLCLFAEETLRRRNSNIWHLEQLDVAWQSSMAVKYNFDVSMISRLSCSILDYFFFFKSWCWIRSNIFFLRFIPGLGIWDSF